MATNRQYGLTDTGYVNEVVPARQFLTAGGTFINSTSAITTGIKSLTGLAYASVKTRNGLAIASIKTINGLA